MKNEMTLWMVLHEHDHGANGYIIQAPDGTVMDNEKDEAVAAALGIDIEGDILTYAPLSNARFGNSKTKVRNMLESNIPTIA